MQPTLKAMAEARYGRPITDAEFAEAETYARMKLDFQNNLFGTNHGDGYLAILISETVNQNRIDAMHREEIAIRQELIHQEEARRRAEAERMAKIAQQYGVAETIVRQIAQALEPLTLSTQNANLQFGGI